MAKYKCWDHHGEVNEFTAENIGEAMGKTKEWARGEHRKGVTVPVWVAKMDEGGIGEDGAILMRIKCD